MTVSGLALLALAAIAAQDATDIADMDLAQLAEVEIEVATGRAQPLSRAPAVATVITAAQIEAMGAGHLDEVLETVPGLHVVPSRLSRLGPIYSIRGIHSGTNAQVLMLIDGVPITQLLSGGRVLGFRLPASAIERVELIRGPGSAVYGADALAGVINVITKTAAGTTATELGLRAGSFDSGDAWAQHRFTAGGWEVGLSVAWQATDGDGDRIVAIDSQTAFDQRFGTRASLAPGPLATRNEVVDAHLGLRRGGWDVKLWGWTNRDRGNGAGAAQALDPTGSEDATMALADVAYSTGERLGAWQLTTRASFFYLDQLARFVIFPPGAVLPIGSDGNLNLGPDANLVSFPDGMIAAPGDLERTSRLETIVTHDGRGGHRWRLAAGFAYHDVDTRSRKNFGTGVIDGSQPVVDGTLVDVTDTPFIFLADRKRDEHYLSIQDEWAIGRRWALTAGVRYDAYSDFGGTFNPRLALVWTAPHRDLSAKLLYGSAFRAPSFGEQFTVNNPINLGNPALDPETVDTLELAFDYRPSPVLRTAFNVFAYRIDGLIDLVPDPGATTRTTRNAFDQDGFGAELELDWRLPRGFRVAANLAWQQSENRDTGARVGDAPGRQLYLLGQWQHGAWLLDGRLRWIGGRRRPELDPRPPIDDYTLVDLTVRRSTPDRRWSVAAGARNLLDEDAREPSGVEIPGDFALAGRGLFLELRYRP